MEQQGKGQKLSETIRCYLRHCAIEKNLDVKTLKAYETDLAQFVRCIGDVSTRDVSKEAVRGYLHALSRFRYKTVKRKLATLRAMFNYAEWEDEACMSPLRKMRVRMREPIRLPMVMTLDEVRALLRVVSEKRASCTVGTSAHVLAVRDVAIIELLFASGVRVSELCNLRMCDVDMTLGLVRIIGKGNKERIVDVRQAATMEALRGWLSVRQASGATSPFFVSRLSNRLSPQSVRLLVRQSVQRAGIGKRITPHTFRHTYATLLLEEGVDITYIQHLLGHSSIVTTQIYTHVNLHMQREILSTKHPRRLI